MRRFPFYFSLGPVSYQAEQSGFPEPVREWPAKGGEILFVNHTLEKLLLSGDFVYFVLQPLSYPVDKAGQRCASVVSQPKKNSHERPPFAAPGANVLYKKAKEEMHFTSHV